MKKLVLHLPFAAGLLASVNPIVAPLANAATVSVTGAVSLTCTYTGVSTDANGNMTVNCGASVPAPTPTAAPPGATPTAAPPAPTPSPPAPTPTQAVGCPATPANAREITALSKPPNGGTFPSGQDHYNNPATTTSDGTIASSQILVVPFTHTNPLTPTRATAGPGNFGGVAGFQMVLSKCPGSFASADFAVADNQYCERKRDNGPTLYFQYCPLTIGSSYYVNIRPVSAQESTTAFVFNFN